jgi:hypothetical protein
MELKPMTERDPTLTREVEETVLRHPEGIAPAIMSAIALAVMVRFLISMIWEHPIVDISLLVLWGIVFLAIASIFAWSVAGTTVVRTQSGRLTMTLALCGRDIWEVRSVSLKDVKNVVIRERVYGYKGKRIHRYEVVFGQTGEQRELLGFLTRNNALVLANGVLREFLTTERSL